MRKVTLVAVAACAGLFGALAQSALSGDGKIDVADRIAAKSGPAETVTARTVPGATTSATKPFKTISSAFGQPRTLGPNENELVRLRCPKGNPVTGLFEGAPGVFLGVNTTEGSTTVALAVVNVTNEPRNWRPGVRCIRR